MKYEIKQDFSSSSVLSLFGLVTLSLVIISMPWNRQSQDPQAIQALQKAEVVGYQVVQIYREAAKAESASGSRSPASVDSTVPLSQLRTTGTMGMDPWGMPYHYRILSSEKQKIRILVWSSGPNKRVESTSLDNENQPVPRTPNYSGDDVGLILTVSQN